jgi:hypothetical protein
MSILSLLTDRKTQLPSTSSMRINTSYAMLRGDGFATIAAAFAKIESSWLTT